MAGGTEREGTEENGGTADGTGRKVKMAYWFSVVEDLIEKRGA